MAYAVTGPMARGSGLDCDLRRADAYSVYPELDFDVCVEEGGDCLARYLVRTAEMRESIKICLQCLDALDGMKGEPFQAKVPRTIKPPEGEVYWQGWDGADYEVYRYAMGSGVTENLTDNMVDDYTPAVKNGILVWSQWDGQDYEIYRLIFDTSVTTRLTDDEYDDQRPRVNASGQIVWQKWDGSDYEVYAYK